MKIWKRALSTVLASVMVLGLCACSKEGGINVGNGGDASGKLAENTDTSLAKEYIYSMEEFDLSGLANQNDCTVLKLSKVDDLLYMVLRTYNENYEEEYKLVKMNVDGSNIEYLELQTANESEAEAEETATEDVLEDDAEVNVYEYNALGNFAFKGEHLYALKTYTFEDYTDPDNYVSENKNYVCCWDLDGNMKWQSQVVLNENEESWSYVNALTMLPGGNVGLLISGDKQGIIEVDKEGEVKPLRAIEDLEEYFTNSGYTAEACNGKMLLSYYNDDWSELSVIYYDFSTGDKTAPYPLPSNIAYNGLSNLCVNESDDLMYTNSQGVFKYRIGDAEPKQVMSFINSDLNVSHFDGFLYLDRTHFIGFYSVYDEVNYTRTLEGGIFTKVEPENVPDKEMLVLGTNYVANDIKQRVVDFNKSSQTHRIMIKDYSQYITNDDYMAGYNQLNNDIISGNIPDILVVDSYNMSLNSYVSKGLLADIGELIAKDDVLSKEEYMTNVFDAHKIDGKLYEIIPSFYVSTYIGKKSLIGEPAEWTMQDAQAVVNKMPEGARLFSEMTRDGFINTVFEMCGSEFIDVSTGKCTFDSPEFIAIMEYAMTLPEELDDSYYGADWYSSYESQYRDDKTLLSNCYLSGMEGMVYSINGSFGEDVSFVGLPSSGGKGSAVYASNSYALSAKSENLDVAWDFMKYYLTDEYQATLEWQLPVSKEKFDELAQKATKKPVYKDENGNEVEEDYHYWMNEEDIILEPLTQAQVDEITAFVASVNTKAYYNEDVRKILDEELDAYFSGQKSAQEVAGLIQSRVQLYVSENS